ncbi:hypothetical protein ACWPN4_22790 [Gordonia polyisoprenivorans]
MTKHDGHADHVPPAKDPVPADAGGAADRVRWDWVLAVVAGGLVIAAVACALPLIFDSKFGTWQSIFASTLAAGGMNVLLAAVLIGIERKIVEHVRVAASASASAAVEEGTRDLRDATTRLAQRIDDIDDQLKERLAQQEAQRSEVLDDVERAPSWESVVAALLEADGLNAVVGKEITAPLSGEISLHAPRMTVSLMNIRPFNDGALDVEGEAEAVLTLMVSAGEKSATVTWREGETPQDMLTALAIELTRQAMNGAVSTPTASVVFPALRTALEQSITARTQSWFTGSMLERLNDEWVVTVEGLESRTSGLELPLADGASPIAYGVQQIVGPDPEPPDPPEGVDLGFWKVAVARTHHHARRRRNRTMLRSLGL